MTQAAPSMFAIFRKREFSLLWTAQLVSTIGSALTDLAAGILAYKITGSALFVGLTLMVTAVPTLLVGLVAGVFVDRWPRKRILLGSDLIRAILVFLIPIGYDVFGDTAGILSMYVLIFLAATVRQFFDPAWESVLPEIATEEELSSANSFLSISSFGSTAVGFAAAGILAVLDRHLPFFIDAGTFLFSFSLVLLTRIPAIKSDEVTTVGVVVANLRSGVSYLWATPMLRTLLLVGLPVTLSFGLWNVLLLPMAIRALNASYFEYGLQEGLTSVGFVIGSLVMAKYADRLPEGTWYVAGTVLMGIFGALYGLSPNIQVAIVMVMVTGFLNSPMSLARRLLLQKSIPREMRGRVFSAFFVSRDVVFLIGMSGAGLADLIDVRVLIVVASLVLVAAGIVMQLTPGLGRPAAEWRRALQLLRTAPTAPGLGTGRPATMLDLDRLLDRLPELRALSMTRRNAFLVGATVSKAPPGCAIVRAGEPSNAAYFVLSGRAVAGIPGDGGEVRSLSTMGAGDFFGEIAALTGSPRTADVMAEEFTDLLEVPATTLRELRELPEMSALINSKLSERLTRTANTDLIRLAGLDQRDLRDLRRRRPAAAPEPAAAGPATGEAGA
jgi:MFS transporter, DHA3 family, macrolide efflux protein